MKRVVFLAVITLFFVSFCKKKKDETPEPATTTSTTGGTTTGTAPASNGTTNYDALLEVSLSSMKSGTIQGSAMTSCKALFGSATFSNEAFVNLQSMGTVKLNNVTFANHLFTSNYYYVDTTYINFSSPYIWNISGTPNLSAGTFTNATPFPAYPNFTTLPSSCSKASGLSISLDNLSGCDFVEMQLLGPTGSQYLFPKRVPGNSASVGLSSSELSSISTGTNGYFSVKFYKDNVQTVNNKKINVRSGIAYSVLSFTVTN